jgi:hypothetical protein
MHGIKVKKYFQILLKSNLMKIRLLGADLTHADGQNDEQEENKWR